MKVSRFGPKKRPDPSPEDEWLRQALLDAQDADLKTTLQDAPPPYPHTVAYLRREKRQAKRTRREYRPRWQRFTQLAACLVLAVVLVAGGAVALEAAAQREPVGIPSQDVEHRVHLFALLSSDGKREVPALQFHEHCPGKGYGDRRERGMVSPHFPSDQDLGCAWGNRSGKLCIE